MTLPLLSAPQMMAIRKTAERGFTADVTIKRPMYGSDADGDDALIETRTTATVKGWIRQTGGDNVAGPDAGSLVTTGQFELAVAIGTDIAPRDFVEIALPTPVNERQTVVVTGADGGTFTLSFEGQETAPLAFDIGAAALQTALEGLSTIGAGNVTVEPFGSGFMVEFVGDLAGAGQGLLVADADDLTGDGEEDVEVGEYARGTSVGRYTVADVMDDETWPAMLNCTVRRRA